MEIVASNKIKFHENITTFELPHRSQSHHGDQVRCELQHCLVHAFWGAQVQPRLACKEKPLGKKP